MAKNGNKYEEQICSAIEYIVNNAVETAPYDKTIQGVILSCEDKAIGKYRIQYQDAIFYAYSTNVDAVYTDGTSVYILVPGNDFSNNKTILGTVANLGVDYSNVETDVEDAYSTIGGNVIINNDYKAELCTYKTNEQLVLYDKESNKNLINFNEELANLYIKDSETKDITIAAKIQTEIPMEQRIKGDYGIVVEIAFEDKDTKNENGVTYRNYIINSYQVLGNPYIQPTPQRFYNIFEIDKEKYKYVNKIYAYNYDFPIQKDNKPNDIFLTDFEISAAAPLTSIELGSNALVLYTEKGSYFLENEPIDISKPIRAQIKVKGRSISAETDTNTEYYWFRENAQITIAHPSYNIYGGRGWECLNNFTPIDDNTKQWVPGSYIFNVNREDTMAYQVTYKCVAIYNGTILEKQIVFTDYKNKDLTISIESTNGVKFYGGRGTTNLICHAPGHNYKYTWIKVDNTGTFYSLPETIELNQDYENDKNKYLDLKRSLENNSIIPGVPFERLLEQYKENYEAWDKIERIEENNIYNVQAINIYKTMIYKCSVFDSKTNKYIGTASIALNNSVEDNGYNLVIINGSQTYKYNEEGQKPNQNIPTLSYEIYDSKGEKISSNITNKLANKWIVPTVNTMLDIKSKEDYKDENTKTYENQYSFNYDIKDKYKDEYKQNDITLQVTIDGIVLTANTKLLFVKEGDNGTNGTNYILEIVPNNSMLMPRYPSIIQDKNGNKRINIQELPSANKWFKAKLWKDGKEEYSGVEGDKKYKIKWSMLGTKKDKHSFTITENGQCSFDNCEFDVNNVDIVQCKMTYIDKSKSIEYAIYATLPVNYIILSKDIKVDLVDNTGFRFVTYGEDGQHPRYDNTLPFELKVTEPTNYEGQIYDGDITYYKENGNSVLGYEWNYIGNLEIDDDKEKNYNYTSMPIGYKPLDIYRTELTNHGIFCIIKDKRIGDSQIASVHIPIHFMLNRYGHGFINDWDGNSVQIDKDGNGVILAPQAGFGKKDEYNSFTGVLLGTVKNLDAAAAGVNKRNEETGFFAYNKGERTIFLDSEKGSALFGKSGAGQIIVDPSNSAMLYSHDFWTDYEDSGLPKTDYDYEERTHTYKNQSDKGMLIDLTTPRIIFGSGSFRVDPDGHLTAEGGGTIAGWEIGQNALFDSGKNTKMTLRSSRGTYDEQGQLIKKGEIYSNDHDSLTSTKNGFYLSEEGLSIGNKFKVTNEGIVTIGRGAVNNTGKHWTINGSGTDDTAITYGNKGTANSVYIGTDEITLGRNFSVSNNGSITSKSGTIGGWTIDGSTLSANGITMSSNGTISADNWSISGNGTATFSNGQIGGWTIGKDYLASKNGNVILNESGDLSGPNWWIRSNGTAEFNKIYITNDSNSQTSMKWGNFEVTTGGVLKASNAEFSGSIKSGSTISGSTVNGSAITGGSIDVTTNNGGYLRAGTNTNHPEVSALNCNDAIVMGGEGGKSFSYNSSKDAFYFQYYVAADDAYKIVKGGTVYKGSDLTGGSMSSGYQNFCIGITVNDKGLVTQTKWVGLQFRGGILTGVGDIQIFNT